MSRPTRLRSRSLPGLVGLLGFGGQAGVLLAVEQVVKPGCERSSGQYLFDSLVTAGEPFGIGMDGFTAPGI